MTGHKQPQGSLRLSGAGAEGVGSLLRQAISLYSERFPIFLKVSLIAYTPLIILVFLNYFSNKVIPWERISKLGPFALPAVAIFLLIAMMFSQIGANVIVNAVAVPVVLQAIIAPLRPIKVAKPFAELRRRWRSFLGASLIVGVLTFIGSLLLFLPGLFVRACFALYAPVIMMEGLGIRDSLKRSFRLMKRAWTTVLAISVVQVGLPAFIYKSIIHLDIKATSEEAHVNFNVSGNLSQLLIVLITPLTAIIISLLYLKTRQAGGEGVKEAIEEFTSHEMPSSKWQSKMKSGSRI